MGRELTMRKNDGVRVHHKKDIGVSVHHDRKSSGVGVHHEKERCGESLP